MKAIRILSIIGLFVSFLGFFVGLAYLDSTDAGPSSSWVIILALYLVALCIVNLSIIKVKTRDDRIEKLEAELKLVKENISVPIQAEEEAEKEKT